MTGAMQRLSVHLLWDAESDAVALLRERLDAGIALTVGRETPVPVDCRVLVGGRPDAEVVAGLEQLERLVVPWAGIPPVIREIALARPALRVHNLHHNASATAELAVALLLAAAKCLVPHDQDLRRNDWSRRYAPSPSIVLEGRTALVLGFGAIGKRVARACLGLGMRVLATRRSAAAATVAHGAEVHPAAELADLLPSADALIVTLPLTDATEGLIGAAELAALPPDALLVNVSRGPIVVEEALYTALNDGSLAGAGLDVWYQYPRSEDARPNQPPSQFPFRELDNVVMSPHRAGSSRDNDRRRMIALAHLLNAVAGSEDVPNPVDPSAGY